MTHHGSAVQDSHIERQSMAEALETMEMAEMVGVEEIHQEDHQEQQGSEGTVTERFRNAYYTGMTNVSK